MVLTCRRTGFFSAAYEVGDEHGKAVGEVSFGSPHHGQITVRSRSYVADRLEPGRWRLQTVEGAEVAAAERSSKQPLSLRVDFDAGRWEIATEPGVRQNALSIRAGGVTVGRVEKLPGLWSNKLRLTAQDDLALEICVFVQWLVGAHWAGVAGTAGAAATQR